MRNLRVVILGIVAVAVAAACGASSSPSFTFTSPAPSAAAQTAAPVPSVAPSTAAVSATPAGATAIALKEWSVTVPGTIKAGKASFTITNDGTAPHELLVFKSDLAPAAYPTDGAGDIVEDGAGVALVSDGDNIDPGGTQARTVDLTAPGTYLFVCNIAGHFKQGMFTVVTVTQ
ncbi:MAG: plastocyanin/azurin family copper-binding protein [Chloroflexota bacterium]